MKRLALLLSLVACVAVARAADMKPAAGGVATVEDAWAAGMKANDLDAIMKCYASDAILYMPGAPRLVGTTAIRGAYEGWLGANTITDVQLKDRGAQTAGTMSTGWGEFDITMTPKAGGDAVHMTGRYTETAVKRAGKWVYLVDHASHAGDDGH